MPVENKLAIRLILASYFLLISSCKHSTISIKEYKATTIQFENTGIIVDSLSNIIIINELANCKSVEGPVKAYYHYVLQLVNANDNDTQKVIIYAGNQVFLFKDRYFKANNKVLPQAILKNLPPADGNID